MGNLNRNRRKRTDPLAEGATISTPKPGDYPIGSAHSRAAARMLAGRHKSKEIAIQVVYVSPDGTRKDGPLIRFPAAELNLREEAALRERLGAAKERMKGYSLQSSIDAIRTEYHKA